MSCVNGFYIKFQELFFFQHKCKFYRRPKIQSSSWIIKEKYQNIELIVLGELGDRHQNHSRSIFSHILQVVSTVTVIVVEFFWFFSLFVCFIFSKFSPKTKNDQAITNRLQYYTYNRTYVERSLYRHFCSIKYILALILELYAHSARFLLLHFRSAVHSAECRRHWTKFNIRSEWYSIVMFV